MVISVASGKGGTGKTTLAVNLAKSINNSVYIDCDVEEPNGFLLLKPTINKVQNVYKKLPQIDFSKCGFCGKCKRVCEFNAIIKILDEILIVEEMCHSCGACTYFCPKKAITEIDKAIGVINSGFSDNCFCIEGVLQVGEVSASPLIKELKKKIERSKVTVIDSPPGTSCSMVETVKNSDFCILVTESTPFGLNDLKLAIEVVKNINIPFGVVINKYDPKYYELEEYLTFNNINILLKIPFDRNIAELYSKGSLLIENNNYKNLFTNLYASIEGILWNRNQLQLLF